MSKLSGKRITFVGLNYFPEDTAIGLYSTHMVEKLVEKGAQVTVVTAFPYYPQWKINDSYSDKKSYLKESHNGANVYRYKQYVPEQPTFFKRILHILSFAKGTYFNLRKIKQADIVISVIPFTASAWLGSFHARKRQAKHWIHIQDFEFDAALQAGVSTGKSFIFKQLFKYEKRILNSAQRVSTISYKMMEKLNQKTLSKSYYLPNWIDSNMVDATTFSQHPYFQGNKFKLLYSGNVGDKQDWDFFLAFAKALPQQHYDIIIVGAGAKYAALKRDMQLQNVHFYDPVPFNELSDLLCSTNAHFLFQKMDVLDTVMPSKLLGMMASAKPSIVLGHVDSEVRRVMEEASAGHYMVNPDVSKAVEQVEFWRLNPEKTLSMGVHARSYALSTYGKESILEKWIQELEAL